MIVTTNYKDLIVVTVIVWKLDLRLPVQSVPITAKVTSSNPVHAWCHRYNIM